MGRDGVKRYQSSRSEVMEMTSRKSPELVTQCCKKKSSGKCGGLFKDTKYKYQRSGSCTGTPFVLPAPLDKGKGVASQQETDQAYDALLLADFAKDYYENKDDSDDKHYINNIRSGAYGSDKQRLQLSLNLSFDQIYVDNKTTALCYVAEWSPSKLGPHWNTDTGGFPSKVVAFRPSKD